MMWDQVMKRVIAELEHDPVIAEIFQGHIRMAGTGDQQIPVLEWTLIGDIETELWAPMIVQFDLWTASAASTRSGEFHLRALYSEDLPIVLNGDLQMWAQYTDGSMLATPDRANFVGRAIRFRFTPLRWKYASRVLA